MKYSKYPSYRDSGTDWLGSIPNDWNIVRNKQAFNFEKTLVGKKSKEYTLLSLTLQGIKVRDIESGKGKFPAEFDTYQAVKKNDIVFCLFDIDETPRTVGLSQYKGMITGAYNVARCNIKTVPEYIYYYYLSIDEYKGLKPFYTGLRKVVRTETFMNIQLALPSYQEQQTIANYLDKATAKIDTLIEKQTKLIELLREKRQAVISTAVTRGLDNTVAMKDSGVEWLGEIPEHWGSCPLKYLGNFINGYAFNSSSFTERGIKVLKITNIQHMMVKWDDTSYVNELLYDSLPMFRVYKGDLVFALTRPIISTGIKVALITNDEKMLINQRNSIFRTNKIDTSYIYYILLNKLFVHEFESRIDKTGQQPNISHIDIGDIIVPLPNKQEQEKVVSYLNEPLANSKITSSKFLAKLKFQHKKII